MNADAPAGWERSAANWAMDSPTIEVLGLPPTVESIVVIAPDGQSVITESHEEISDVSLPPLP